MRKNSSKNILFVHEYVLGPEDCGSNRVIETMNILEEAGIRSAALCSGYNPLTGKKINRDQFSRNRVFFYRSLPPVNNKILRFIYLIINMLLILPALLRLSKKHDIIYFSSPPLFTGFGVYLLKFFTGKEYILEIRDLWPDSGIFLNLFKRRSTINFVFRTLENLVIKNSKLIICLTKGIEENIRFRFPEKNIFRIENGVSEKKIKSADNIYKLNNNKINLLFMGNLTNTSDPMLIIKISQYFREKIQFHIAGEGKFKDKILKSVEEKNLSNIVFHGPLANKEIMDFTQTMDISIIPLLENNFFRGVISNKLLSSMGAGIPVVLFGSGESADIIRHSRGGFVIKRDELELEEFKILIEKYLHDEKNRYDIGLRGQNFIRRNFTREIKTRILINILKEI